MKDNNFKFQEKLDKLESIIKEVESGKVDIDELVIKFQEGKKLIMQLTKKLNEIEEQVKEIDIKSQDNQD